jgi:hypothetical protein
LLIKLTIARAVFSALSTLKLHFSQCLYGFERGLGVARDSIFSAEVDDDLKAFGLKILRTPVQAPKANAYCERLMGPSAVNAWIT